VDLASLIPCTVADTITAARAAMRPAVGLYAGFFPRYNRLLAEAGFGDAVRTIKEAFDRGGRDAAANVVPDELIDAVALAGTPDTCRARLAAYRRAGLALPQAGQRPLFEVTAVLGGFRLPSRRPARTSLAICPRYSELGKTAGRRRRARCEGRHGRAGEHEHGSGGDAVNVGGQVHAAAEADGGQGEDETRERRGSARAASPAAAGTR
jgi:hypothetical protein